MNPHWLLWALFLLGYAICSGANVAYFAFSIRDLRKEVERGRHAAKGSREAVQAKHAASLLKHLEDPNWTLAAILLTNVFFGVRLSQMSEMLVVGWLAVVLPIISITIFGEFFAQATFLRYAGKICYFFSPFVWLLKWGTSPASYPLARTVDALYGREGIRRLNEQDLLSDLRLELSDLGADEQGPHSEILDRRELTTLMNAAQADDEPAREIGSELDPRTIIPLPFDQGRPVFPDEIAEFVRSHLEKSMHPWFVIVHGQTDDPCFLLDADGFVRDYFTRQDENSLFHPQDHIFRARVYEDASVKLGEIISGLLVHQEHAGDDVIDIDAALIWSGEGRWIVTGSDILGRFLRGVPRRLHWRFQRDRRRETRDKLSSG